MTRDLACLRLTLLAGGLCALACGGGAAAKRDGAAAREDAAIDAPAGGATGAGGRGGATGSGPDAAVDAPAPPPDATRDAPATDAGAARDAAGADAARDATSADAAPVAGPPPAPWLDRSVGAVGGVPGGTVAAQTSFTLTGGGADVGGTKDAFYFVYQALKGDGELIARVATPPTAAAAKAGLMVRAGLSEDAANMTVLTAGDQTVGGRLQHRDATGGMTAVGPSDSNLKAGAFVRISRKGTKLLAERSTDRRFWSAIGAADLAIAPDQELYYGVFVDGGAATGSATASFNYLTLDNLNAAPATGDWKHFDLGTIGGTAVYADGALTLTGFGEPFNNNQNNGTGQEFLSYVLRQVVGSYQITAKIAGLNGGDDARAGLMVREGAADQSASRSAAHALIDVRRAGGLRFRFRVGQGAMVMDSALRMETGAPVWLRLERADTLINGLQTSRYTGSFSTDGASFTTLDTQTFSMASEAMLGVFVGAAGATAAQARVESITYTAPPSDAGAQAPDAAAGN